MIRGQASAIGLSGWVIDEMLVRRSVGMIVAWPAIGGRTFDFSTFTFRQRPYKEAKEEYDKNVAALGDLLGQARHYAQAVEKGSAAKFERDLKLEALVPVVKGELPVIVVANRERDIRNAVAFCDEQKLKMILASGSEAWKAKDLLKEKNVPVILGPSQVLPVEEDDPYDKPYSRAGELAAAGVKFAIATFNSADSRTLPYEAGQAVPFGLPWEEALKAITLYPAQILGLADRYGSIETGKVANLVVTTGDALELRTEVKHVLINGEPTSLENRHLRLYETYRKR
jgi:imidazolonepropionase-like amidohydrolase